MLSIILNSWFGRLGLLMLFVFGAVSLYVLIAFPQDFGSIRWHNPVYWADHPKAVPPKWIVWFDGSKAEHIVKEVQQPKPAEQHNYEDYTLSRYEIPLNRNTATNPSFISVSIGEVSFYQVPPVVDVYLSDGIREEFLWSQGFVAREGQAILYQEQPFRRNLTSDPEVRNKVDRFFDYLRQTQQNEFMLVVEAQTESENDSIGYLKVAVGGDAFGVLGTDTLGRDIWQGMLFGLPYALLIGLSVGGLVTIVGSVYGSISGFIGGRRDFALQLLVDLIVALPTLPLLIFLVFVMGANIYHIILFLVAFGWTGLVIQLRPWIFQIKAFAFVEFATVKGFPSWRIIFIHVVPQVFPFLFAYFVMAAPIAIIAEASLSFIGLGDPSIPTWGQMLHQVNNTGAVFLGYWWQYLSPGIAILTVAFAFLFLAIVLESVAEPRLRRE